MLANILLLNYNNYFNRIVKYTEQLSEFGSFPNVYVPEVNFNENDGITTFIVLNFEPKETGFVPNYLLVIDPNDNSFTRWFVMEAVRTRGGQYNLSLKRDLLADYYNEVQDATCYIQKGFVNAENPLIFNSEDIRVNQIKQSEFPLRDSTRCAWIVGYLSPNLAVGENSENEPKTISVTYPQEVIPDISEFEFMEYVDKEVNGYLNTNWCSIYIRSNESISILDDRYTGVRWSLNGEKNIYRDKYLRDVFNVNADSETLLKVDMDIPLSVFYPMLANSLGSSELSELLLLNNKVFKDGNIYKKVVITPKEDWKGSYLYKVFADNYPNVFQAITDKLSAANIAWSYPNNPIEVNLQYSAFIVTLEETGVPFTEAEVTLNKSIRPLNDAPYKMFCIPYSENTILKVNEDEITLYKENVLQIASSLAMGLKTGSDGFLYDIQLLPYCPIEDKFTLLVGRNGMEYTYAGTEHIDYDVITDNDIPVGYMFYCDKSSFTTNIGIDRQANGSEPIEFKVNNETTLTRIVAPNYANQDNFNLYMNYGIDYINVDCTYKPLTPYIKLNINYKGLYGSDFNDNRGLILGGDYSLPVISDAWVNYQIQNKNYANIFERETQHLEYAQKWNVAQTAVGAINGIAIGGMMGAKVGGIGGAIGGAAMATVGGALDIAQTTATFSEAMDYRRDTFNFNLQNIQALPMGLVKTSAFNYNSKIFPFVEFYSCTDTEKEIVRNKIKYTGMTLNVIGKINEYLNNNDLTYIQAKLVRLTTIAEDTHLIGAIDKELQMGVYY